MYIYIYINIKFTLLSKREVVLPIGIIQMSYKEKFCPDSSKVQVMQ